MGVWGFSCPDALRSARLFRKSCVEKVVTRHANDIRGPVIGFAGTLSRFSLSAFSLCVRTIGRRVTGAVFLLVHECESRGAEFTHGRHSPGIDRLLVLLCLALLLGLPGRHPSGTGQ